MITLDHVSKYFGSTVALDNLTIDFPRGKMIGLFGPNGAGKSTTMKLIAGLNRPDQGNVLVDGKLPRQSRENIAYLPEIDYLYSRWTLEHAARFTRTFYADWDDELYRKNLDFLDLKEEMKMGKISKGQRAKCKLLLAISRRAPYLLLDEPFSGIDILTRDEIIDALIRDYCAGEQTIMISTHEIDEIENLVEHVIFLDQGRIQLEGDAEALRMQHEKSLVDIMKEAFKHAR